MSKRERRRAPAVTNPEPVVSESASEVPATVPPAPASVVEIEPTTLREKNPRRRKGTKGGKKTKGRRRRKGKKARKNPMVRWAKGAVVLGAVALTSALGYGIYRRVTETRRVPKCGEKYMGLVVTASGNTIDDAYGAWASTADYQEWRELARSLSVDARERFHELGRVECEATGGTGCEGDEPAGGRYLKWDALVQLNNRMAQKYDDLPSEFLTMDMPAAIAQARAVIFDALCLMQRSDEAIVEYGGTVPVTPTVGGSDSRGASTWKWIALGGAAVIAVGGVGYALGGSAPSAPARTPSLPTARASRPE